MDEEGVSDQEIVDAAVEAAETVIFSRYDRSEIRDVDVGVTFDEGILEVDVYLDAEGEDVEQAADDAALAARSAVDDLLE